MDRKQTMRKQVDSFVNEHGFRDSLLIAEASLRYAGCDSRVFFSLDVIEQEAVFRRCLRFINAVYRKIDESHKYPINGQFNVTERAIRLVARYQASDLNPWSYAAALEQTLSNMVNYHGR